MRQVLLQNPQEIAVIDVPTPEVPQGWVLIRTAYCGICGSDLHAYAGETIFGKVYPFHIGHEVCGYVEKTGDETSPFAAGDLVVINPFFTCNSCDACFTDRSNNCAHRTTIGLKGPSGFSEYILVPQTSVYKAKTNVSPSRLCLAEPIANVIYALERMRIDSHKDVLINGVGAIGLIFVQLVKGLFPHSLTVCDFNQEKLAKAMELGANKKVVPDELGDAEFDVIIDCTGSAKCVGDSIHRLAFGGQLLSFGVCHSEATFEANPFELYKRDATIVSSFALNKSSMQKAVSLLEGNDFNTDILIDSIQPLSQLEASILNMRSGKAQGKVVIDTTAE